MHSTLVVGDVKTPLACFLSYEKSTADCHFWIAGDFFINGMACGRCWNINAEISAASTFMIVTATITITSNRFF